MVDNLKKKKLDRKRISLTQKHETRYLKDLCKKYLETIDKHAIVGISNNQRFFLLESRICPSSIGRICEALLKCLKK